MVDFFLQCSGWNKIENTTLIMFGPAFLFEIIWHLCRMIMSRFVMTLFSPFKFWINKLKNIENKCHINTQSWHIPNNDYVHGLWVPKQHICHHPAILFSNSLLWSSQNSSRILCGKSTNLSNTTPKIWIGFLDVALICPYKIDAPISENRRNFLCLTHIFEI